MNKKTTDLNLVLKRTRKSVRTDVNTGQKGMSTRSIVTKVN